MYNCTPRLIKFAPSQAQVFYEVELELIEWQVLHDIQPKHPKLREIDLIRILKNHDRTFKILKTSSQVVRGDPNNITTKLVKWRFVLLAPSKRLEDIHFLGVNGLVYKIYQIR